MNLRKKKILAGKVLKRSPKRVWLDSSKESLKDAITRADIRGLIIAGAIVAKPKKGVSRFWARKNLTQKRKGRRVNQGSRKGKKTARANGKDTWINKIRSIRRLLKKLKAKQMITNEDFRTLYQKSKGGFFRNKGHVKLYMKENNIVKVKP